MTLHRRSYWLGAVPAIPAILWAPSAFGQTVITNAPPADEAAVVSAPKPVAVPPADAPVHDSMHVAVSMGGQFQTGNSHLWAVTGQGKYDIRRGADAFAASVIGNYARTETFPAAATVGTPPPPGIWADSTDNIQGKLRYDRFLTNDASLYLQVTGTHDTFQAVTFRLNLDPGFKYLFVSLPSTKLWGEIGYDFQYDLHYSNESNLEQAGAGGLTLDANGDPYLISQTDTIESSRLFAGFYHAFNKEVSLSTGLEWLQGFGGSNGQPPAAAAGYSSACTTASMLMGLMCVDPVTISLKSTRINFDALLAASVGGGFSVGVGYSMKYNSAPLPGKVDVDMSGTFNLIYALAIPAPVTAPPPAPCPPPPPPPPPPPTTPQPAPAAPAPATIPPTPAPVTMPPPAPPPTTIPPTASL